MNIFKQMAFGAKLTKATTVVEQIEARDGALPIGMRGLDGLSDTGRNALAAEVRYLAAYTKNIPRHLVTEALFKNMRLSIKTGRLSRAQAQSRLLDALVEAGAAISADEFKRSYA